MLNEYDQFVISHAQSMLRQGEVALHMGVARNDANLAGQMVLAAAIGVKLIPPLFFLVTTNQRLIAFKSPGYKFSGAPRAELEDTIVVEYGQARLARVGTTTLGGKDLFFQTPQGEQRFSVVRQLNTMSSGGPTTQNQFYMEYPGWIAHQYQTGFATVGQTPTLEMVFQQIQQGNQQRAAQSAWQASRKKHPKRVKLAALSAVAGVLSLIALIATAVAVENYHHESASYDDSHRSNYMVDGAKRAIEELKSGKREPYSHETKAEAIARNERELAKNQAEWKKRKADDADDYDAALLRLILTLIGSAIPIGAFIALRVMARKVPNYVDEDPSLAQPGAAPGAAPGVAPA